MADGVEALELVRGEGRLSPPHGRSILLENIDMQRLGGHGLLREIGADPRPDRMIVFMLTTSRSRSDIDAANTANVAGRIVKRNAGEAFHKVREPVFCRRPCRPPLPATRRASMIDISRAGRGRYSDEPAPAWLARASNIATKSSAVARSRAPPEISELLQIDDRAGSWSIAHWPNIRSDTLLDT